MRIRFVYAGFERHAESHPELLQYVPCDEYLGPPSLGIAQIAAATPEQHEIEFRDDRLEDVGLDDDVDLVAISCFTPSGRRAMEIADAFRERGTRVVMGGIFPTMRPEEVGAHADAVVLGEGEGAWKQVLADIENDDLAPVYDGADFPVEPADVPLPRIDLYFEKEGRHFSPDDYPVQISRGCPLKCTACAIPKSMGRAMRMLPPEHVLRQIEQLEANGKLASFTEDTSFFPGKGGLRHLSAVLDAVIARGREAPVSYVGISMPMVLATPSSLFTRLREAGIKMFYLVGGFDPVTRRAFTGNDPKAWQQAVDALTKCHDHDIEPYTSFLVGNDDDDEGTFDRMLDLASVTGLRKAEFAVRTPYPGTPDYLRLEAEGRLLHRNWSKYNDANVVFEPSNMSPERLQEGYLHLWREFYRPRQDLAELGHRERTIQF